MPNPTPLSFFVVMSAAKDHRVLRASIDRALQEELSETFRSQARDLLDPPTERIPFSGSYTVEAGEVLFIDASRASAKRSRSIAGGARGRGI